VVATLCLAAKQLLLSGYIPSGASGAQNDGLCFHVFLASIGTASILSKLQQRQLHTLLFRHGVRAGLDCTAALLRIPSCWLTYPAHCPVFVLWRNHRRLVQLRVVWFV
jgi:hypothetical protein